MILWDGDTEDWRYSKVTNGAQIVCDNIIRDAKAKTGDGNIVLIHDIHENSVAGLEMALKHASCVFLISSSKAVASNFVSCAC